MRITKTTGSVEALPYNSFKLNGCTASTIGFNLLTETEAITKRRYCNKVLVHECVSVPELDPLALSRVEFFATSDPCYQIFELYKSSEAIGTTAPTIELQLNVDNLVEGILVNFTVEETCGLPLRLAYRLNGTDEDGNKIILSNGSIYITPCGGCPEGCGSTTWTDVDW